MTHLASTYFDVSKLYLWKRFWKFMAGRHPSYQQACDTMRLIEGETHTLVGKVLYFKRIN